MRIIDAGHVFQPDIYDGCGGYTISFMKREGKKYPFNRGTHSGTNCQEIIRILISRIKYLQYQIPCWQNWLSIRLLRLVIILFEHRAAKRHEIKFYYSIIEKDVELLSTCKTCGHIFCEEKHDQQKAS